MSKYRSAHRRIRSSGVTLIELLVTLVVLGVLAGVAVPSFKSFVDGQKVKTASYDLMTSLMLARSEAVKRNTEVTLAPDTAGAWAGGWSVKAGAITILQQAAVPVTVARLPSDAPANVVFGGSGRPTASSKSYFQISGNSSVKCVTIDPTGIPSTQSASCPSP